MNNHAEVIGIVQSQVKDGQNLNFAIMSSHLLLLMSGSSDSKPDIYADDDITPPSVKNGPRVRSTFPSGTSGWGAIAGSATNLYLINTNESPRRTAGGTITAYDKVIPKLDSEEGRDSYRGDVAIITSAIGNGSKARKYNYK